MNHGSNNHKEVLLQLQFFEKEQEKVDISVHRNRHRMFDSKNIGAGPHRSLRLHHSKQKRELIKKANKKFLF